MGGHAPPSIGRSALGVATGRRCKLVHVVPDDVEPFRVKLPASSMKANGTNAKLPFEPEDVVRAWEMAETVVISAN